MIYEWIGRDCTPQYSLTAGELRQRALDEAHRLDAQTPYEATIGVASKFGPDFLIGLLACFFAGRTVLPLPGPGFGSAQKRLSESIVSVRPRVILTTAAEHAKIQPEAESIGAAVLTIGNAPFCSQAHLLQAEPEIAVTQFTSGTTGPAQAVNLASSAVLANARFTAQAYGIGRDDCSFSWLPHYHDMGLFGGLLFPILAAGRTAQMDPLVFIQKPERWLRAVEQTGATVTGGPAFALSLCLDQISDVTLQGINLSQVKALFCGADPIPKGMLKKVANKLAVARLDPDALFATYGLAESTLYVAGRPGPNEEASCRLFADGQHAIRIVRTGDRDRVMPESAPPDWAAPIEEGEIVVSGPSLSTPAAQYTDRFVRDGRMWLRTGDLGRLSHERLWITGRHKDVLMSRGVSVPATDLEWMACGLDPALNPFGAAAFSVIEDGVEHAVLLVERKRRAVIAELEGLRQLVQNRIASEFGITLRAVEVLAPGVLPRTTSGKVSRARARGSYVEQGGMLLKPC